MASILNVDQINDLNGGGTKIVSKLILTNDFATAINYNFKNKIINGNFDIWQRGITSSASTGGRYLADRWYSESNGTTMATYRQQFALGQTFVTGEPIYYHTFIVNSTVGINNYAILRQNIESVRTLAGRNAVLSFYAKADTNRFLSIELSQVFGTGGTPSAVLNNIGTQKINLTTSWQKISIPIIVPSITGKNLGTNMDDYLRLQFWFDAGTSFNLRTNSLGQQGGTFDISQVQLEEGNLATPFEKANYDFELFRCMRFFQKSYNPEVLPGVSTNEGYFISFAHNTNTLQQTNIRFPVPMRANPTCTLYSPATGLSGKIYNIIGVTDVNAFCLNSSTMGFEINGTNNFISGNCYIFHYSAQCEY